MITSSGFPTALLGTKKNKKRGSGKLPSGIPVAYTKKTKVMGTTGSPKTPTKKTPPTGTYI